MKQLDIFGNEIDVEYLFKENETNKSISRTIKSKFRSFYGFDERNKCKECAHRVVIHYNNKNFHKCRMMGISSSSATDIRLKDYACKLFVKGEKG